MTRRANPLARRVAEIEARLLAIDSGTGRAVRDINKRLDALEEAAIVQLEDAEPCKHAEPSGRAPCGLLCGPMLADAACPVVGPAESEAG